MVLKSLEGTRFQVWQDKNLIIILMKIKEVVHLLTGEEKRTDFLRINLLSEIGELESLNGLTISKLQR